MIISNFVKHELDYLRENCNFTENELFVFNHRSAGKSLNEISESLGYSREHTGKISRKVNNKINRVNIP